MAQSYDDEKYRRFELLQAERHQEQAHFWNRFTAFATLHAGIFVIATSTNVQSQRIASLGVAIAGLGLSGLWAEVQRLSLRYVDRWKPIYHSEREGLGLGFQGEQLNPRVSSTDLANAVPWVVFFVWGIVFILTAISPK